jgi:flavin reductase (DIM6/NTAB) family NADH-FMN oxidoreductase RutF
VEVEEDLSRNQQHDEQRMTADHNTPAASAVSASVSSVLGRVASGIYVLTARSGQHETGMLASWVMQAGFEPPMVSVAVRKGRYVADWLRAGQPFVLNVMPEGESQTLRHFGRGFAPGEPAFEGIDVARTSQGLAVLPSALGHLECEPAGCLDSEDHHVFLARVVGGSLAREDRPMVHVRKNGLRY